MKTSEVVIGVIIALMLIIAFYNYLAWGNDIIENKEIYEVMPDAVDESVVDTIKNYGFLIPNRLMCDSYKELYYLKLYYTAAANAYL